MKSAYISHLEKEVLETDSGEPEPAKPSLESRFREWYAALPEISRERAFSMSELEQALGTQGKYLSAVLLRHGWTRHRRWASTGEYNRYWRPPTALQVS